MSVTDEIKERLDIVEVISSYVPLKKAGRSYKGLCPFHGEKTPSFVVFPESQGWHCFGACGTGGDIFTFIMKRENLDFGEALQFLAAKAGVELQPRSGQATEEDRRLERLRALLADSASYFHYLLLRSGEGKVARDYLEKRGLTQETWEAWQLGFSLESYDALKDRLLGNAYNIQEIEAAGMIVRRDAAEGAGDDRGTYDRFRGRLMFPIRDAQGRTIGFGARILHEVPDRPQPKYINSPQTPLFDKSHVLYGLDMARKAIRDNSLAVIVEGYMDVLMSHQVGVRNVVAGMGTAMTEAQLSQLRRYSANITLALDPDAAGDHATLRGLETARQTGDREWEPVVDPTGLVHQESRLKTQLRIATLPAGLDPDELARGDPERWRQVLAEARPIVDYYLDVVFGSEDLTSAHGKSNAVARMAPIIREIADPVSRNHYIQLLARRIRADERIVAEQVLAASKGSAPGRQASAGSARAGGRPAAPVSEAHRFSYGLEERILACLLLRPDLLARLDADMIASQTPPLSPDDFAGTENRAILGALQALPLAEDAPAWVSLSPDLPKVLQEHILALVRHAEQQPPLSDERLLKDLGNSVLRLRDRGLAQQIQRLEFMIAECDTTGAREQRKEYDEIVQSCAGLRWHIHSLLIARSMAGSLTSASHQGSAGPGSARSNV